MIPLPGELTTSAGFVGRVDELAELASRSARAAASGLGCVTVAGEAGIGKTGAARRVRGAAHRFVERDRRVRAV